MNPATILVVDDEELLRNALAFEFRRQKYEVVVASCGREAFEIVKSRPIDLILSDVRMPDGDGLELLKNVRSLSGKMPIMMFITGFADLTLEDAYHEGVDAVFSKPFDRKLLVATVRHALIPKAERWADRPERISSESPIEIRVPTLNQPIRTQLINIGRGGMFVALQGVSIPFDRSEVYFRLQPKEGESPVEGAGIIRWIRSSGTPDLPAGFGLEFIFLSDECRDHVAEVIESSGVKAFIPKV